MYQSTHHKQRETNITNLAAGGIISYDSSKYNPATEPGVGVKNEERSPDVTMTPCKSSVPVAPVQVGAASGGSIFEFTKARAPAEL